MLRLAFVGVDVTAGRRDAVAWAEKHRSYADTGVYTPDNDDDDGPTTNILVVALR